MRYMKGWAQKGYMNPKFIMGKTRMKENEMSTADLEQAIDTAFENRDSVNADTKGEVRDAVT